LNGLYDNDEGEEGLHGYQSSVKTARAVEPHESEVIELAVTTLEVPYLGLRESQEYIVEYKGKGIGLT
jgi:hypothetical protein